MPRIDHSHLDDIRNATDDATVAELIGVFVASMTAQLAALTAAINEADNETAARVCHSMKGSAGAIGAPLLMERCLGLETALKTEGNEFTVLVTAVDDEYLKTKVELEAYAGI